MAEKIKRYWVNGPKIARIAFWIFLSIGVGLIIGSFFAPPVGEINSSVLAGVGEIQGFASLGVGFECIFQGMAVTLKTGDTEVNVSPKTNNKE